MKFENGIPIPPQGPRYRWDFAMMAVGQSFFVAGGARPNENRACEQALNAMRSANRRYRHQRRWEWSVVDGGIRIWRVE